MFGFDKNDKAKIEYEIYSSQGKRAKNEDAVKGFYRSDGVFLGAVADGLGGQGSGEIASLTAVNTIFSEAATSNLESAEEFNIWFQKANQKVLNNQTPTCKMMTTLVTILISDEKAMWAHTGDSRLYHFIDNELVSQTFDHSVSQMAVLTGEITQEQVRGHVDRNRLLKALGREEQIKIDYEEHILERNKKHAFLLCTDGFWECVEEKYMEETLRKSKSCEEWLQAMIQIVNRNIKENGDNNSALGIWWEKK